MFQDKSQKGMVLYFVVAVLAMLSLVAFALNFLILGQIQRTRTLGYSVKAFFAADYGVERALYLIYKKDQSPPFFATSTIDGASFSMRILSPGGACHAQIYCIQSVGTYQGVSRAIEASF